MQWDGTSKYSSSQGCVYHLYLESLRPQQEFKLTY